MKIRKELARLKNELLKELYQKYDGHDCGEYYKEGMSCIICSLRAFHKPFALLQYLRARGHCLELLAAELRLYEFLGEAKFKQKIKEEVALVRNTPKKKCSHCGKIVTIWMPYSVAALYVNSVTDRKLRVECAHCSTKIFFTSEELKIKKRIRNGGREENLLYALNLVNRFGYHDEDNSEPQESEDDDENYEDNE